MTPHNKFLAIPWAAAFALLLLLACEEHGRAPATERPQPSADGAEATAARPTGLTARGILRTSEVEEELAVEGAEISMRMLTPHGDNFHVAIDGARLKSGESFVVEVDLRSPQHLTLLYRSGDGSSAVLYPRGDEPAKLEPGTHRLPPAGSPLGDLLVLDDNTGEEVLVLISSRDPLPSSDPALGGLVEEIRVGKGELVEDDPEPTVQRHDRRKRIENRKKQSLRSRGVERPRSDGSSIDAKPGDDGIAVLTIIFDHVAS